MIEKFSSDHAESVTNLHYEYLTGLLREMGRPAIQAFYLGAANSHLTVAHVFKDGGRVVGFVFGSTDPLKLRKEIFKDQSWRIFLTTSLGLIRKPGLVRYLIPKRGGANSGYDSDAVELIYLAVGREQRSTGIGQKLVREFEKALPSEIDSYELSVDSENYPAFAFYQRLGFEKILEYREYGIDHFRLRKTLGAA